MSLYTLNRLNTRILDTIKVLGDLHTACQTLAENPDQEIAEHLAGVVSLYRRRSDSMLAQVALLAKHFQSADDTDEG